MICDRHVRTNSCPTGTFPFRSIFNIVCALGAVTRKETIMPRSFLLVRALLAVIGLLLLVGPQKASAETIFACVNTTTGLLQVVAATKNCPPASSGFTWIKINWNATAGGQANNVRSTPPVFLEAGGQQGLLVGVTNVGTVPHSIKAEVIDGNGNSFVILDGNTPLNPNNSTGASKSFFGFNFVKFTVLDGTAEDIRANAQELLGGGVVGSFLVAE
jgi:hypothetical protein